MNRAGSTIQPNRKRGSKDPLTVIPSIGPSLATDLRLLGFEAVSDLKGADPEQMYEELCRKTAPGKIPAFCIASGARCTMPPAPVTTPSFSNGGIGRIAGLRA